jgi:hypothetical protein
MGFPSEFCVIIASASGMEEELLYHQCHFDIIFAVFPSRLAMLKDAYRLYATEAPRFLVESSCVPLQQRPLGDYVPRLSGSPNTSSSCFSPRAIACVSTRAPGSKYRIGHV